MSIDEKLMQLAVKIKCNGLEGSGCLIQPDTKEFTYVLTAKHCIEEEANKVPISKEDIIIKRFEAKEEDTPLKVIDYLIHNELDLAIIMVEYIENLPQVGIGVPCKNSEVTIYGYPNHLNSKDPIDKRQNVSCKISFLNNNFFELIPNTVLTTYFNSLPELVKGISGGGVFYEKNDELTLVGIFKGLKSPTGAYGICAIDIIEINKMLDKRNLPDLTPSCLSSFEPYLTEAFNGHDSIISAILIEKAKKINDINPKIIANLLKEKLFLPHENKSLIDTELWNGWLLLLTYICIDKDECINQTNFSKRSKNGECQNIKFYYSDSLVPLEAIIRHLLTELYDELKHKDYVVINTSKLPAQFFLNAKRIQQIVKQIDKVTLYKNKIEIDDPHCTKDISCVHIHQFAMKIHEIQDRDDYKLLYDQIRDRIKWVFENVG